MHLPDRPQARKTDLCGLLYSHTDLFLSLAGLDGLLAVLSVEKF